MIMQGNLGIAFDQVNFVSAMDSVMMWIVILVLIVIFGLLIYLLMDWIRYNVAVEMIRQVGEPFYEEENGIKTLKVNYQTEDKSGRIYQKKLKSGGFKEYFKIKGTNWDYINYFADKDFFFRTKRPFWDFKNRGIKLFLDQQKGLVPLRLANPGFDYSGVSLNEVIGAVADSLHEREQLYGEDFWSKYGALITIASLIAFFIIGMIFMIKYQDVFWQNSLKALNSVLTTLKEQTAPNLA